MKFMALGGVALLQLTTACTDQQDVDMTGSSVEAITGHQNQLFPNHVPVLNDKGWGTTVSTQGGIDFKNDEIKKAYQQGLEQQKQSAS